MITAQISDRNYGEIILPADMGLNVIRYSGKDGGGPDTCEMTVGGQSIWQVLRWLGYQVTVYSGNTPVWWGEISEAVISEEGRRIGLSMEGVYNRINVLYSEEQADGSFVAASTGFAQDDECVERYGVRELELSIGDSTSAAATKERDNQLKRLCNPRAVIEKSRGSGETVAQVFCRGKWANFDKIYYKQLSGLEEHNVAGSTSQIVGWGFTGTVSFTADNNKIHEASGKLNGLSSRDSVVVSGSTSNNGTKKISGGGIEPDSITQTTISYQASDKVNDSADNLGIASFRDVVDAQGTHHKVTVADDDQLTVEPADITTAAAGTSVTLTRLGNVRTDSNLTDELGKSGVTLVAHGQVVQQTFTLSQNTSPWYANDISVRLKKVGSPSDGPRLLLLDASDVVLDNVTLDASTITTGTPQWETFTLSRTALLTYGNTYKIRIDRSGASLDADNYYVVGIDTSSIYGLGAMTLYDGSSFVSPSPNASMPFRVRGAWSTSTQIEEIAKDAGLTVQHVDDSGVFSNQYRNGRSRAMEEMERLISVGTDGGNRVQVDFDRHGVLFIREDGGDDGYWIFGKDGRLKHYTGADYVRGMLPYGEWVTVTDMPTVSDAIAQVSPLQIEWVEYDVAADEYNFLARDQVNPWGVGSILDG